MKYVYSVKACASDGTIGDKVMKANLISQGDIGNSTLTCSPLYVYSTWHSVIENLSTKGNCG